MAERNATDFLNVRLPLYAYTAPLWTGRRVLEIGCEDGDSAVYLATNGASQVVVIDTDVARIERARVEFPHPRVDYRPAADLRQMGGPDAAFDLVIVPEGKSVITNRNLLAVLRRILSPSGHILISVPAADRRTPAFADGLGYYELVDALDGEFKTVRMLGRTPFLGFGLVEFDSAADALRLDATLLRGQTEAPSHYIAIAGSSPPPALGYALVQVPFAPVEKGLARASGEPVRAPVLAGGLDAAGALSRAELAERRLEESERRGRSRLDEADARLGELRRKLEEALVQSESAVRVSRIQGDEIEALRGRLRRAAEDRAASDAEQALLRRALAEADESVLAMTRRTHRSAIVETAAEVTAVAAADAPGLQATPDLASGVRLVEAEARVADLERDKQELVRRIDEAEAALRQALAVASERVASTQGESTIGARERRDQALVEFHRLTAAHASEVRRLESSVNEQNALVGELEDALRIAEARVVTAEADAAALRRNAKALEDADRARRGRLAELEGKLLRLERERLPAAGTNGSGVQAVAAGPASSNAEDQGLRLAAMEQRALVAEQRAVGLEERLRAAEVRAEMSASVAESRPRALDHENNHENDNEGSPAIDTVPPPHLTRSAGSQNGSHAGRSAAEMQAAIEEVEQQVRHELRMLAAIEETLSRARDEMAHARVGDGPGELRSALAAKDAQLIESRLEMTRVRRDAEARQNHLEREVSDLRAKLHPFGQYDEDPSQSTQLIMMHTTLANIRRRAARLRDELEGFRRRLDSIPAGALSSLLEEIGEDLSEFAK